MLVADFFAVMCVMSKVQLALVGRLFTSPKVEATSSIRQPHSPRLAHGALRCAINVDHWKIKIKILMQGRYAPNVPAGQRVCYQ